MAFFSFLGRALHWIGRILHKAEDVVKDVLPKVITLVNNIKNFDTANPQVGDIITQLIPGDWDDKLKDKARKALPQVFTLLGLFNKELQAATTTDQFMLLVIDKLNEFIPDIRGLYLHDIAILLAADLADNKLTVAEFAGIMQFAYEHLNSKEDSIYLLDQS